MFLSLGLLNWGNITSYIRKRVVISSTHLSQWFFFFFYNSCLESCSPLWGIIAPIRSTPLSSSWPHFVQVIIFCLSFAGCLISSRLLIVFQQSSVSLFKDVKRLYWTIQDFNCLIVRVRNFFEKTVVCLISLGEIVSARSWFIMSCVLSRTEADNNQNKRLHAIEIKPGYRRVQYTIFGMTRFFSSIPSDTWWTLLKS